MKILTLFFLLFITQLSLALTPRQAFKKFFNSKHISAHHCGLNIQKFLLFLDKKNVKYSDGYVVSIHDPYAYLNHFKARWGRKEQYENGETYYRSNWYFHVFLVLDGYAYDFSRKGTTVTTLQNYLRESYLPLYDTQNIFLQGVMSKKSEMLKYQEIEMNQYEIQTYKETTEGIVYSGVFSEMFLD